MGWWPFKSPKDRPPPVCLDVKLRQELGELPMTHCLGSMSKEDFNSEVSYHFARGFHPTFGSNSSSARKSQHCFMLQFLPPTNVHTPIELHLLVHTDSYICSVPQVTLQNTNTFNSDTVSRCRWGLGFFPNKYLPDAGAKYWMTEKHHLQKHLPGSAPPCHRLGPTSVPS